MTDGQVFGQALGLFAVTNVDDIVILALFFGRATSRGDVLRVVAGQYLGFIAILVASVLGALGAGLLPETMVRYLGLLPLALGLRAAWDAWREHRARGGPDDDRDTRPGRRQGGAGTVAAVTLANGGDNIGVYVPVFTTTGTAGLVTYVLVFLALVAVWCVAGHFFARRPAVVRVLSRWGHILLPIVLIGIGLAILL